MQAVILAAGKGTRLHPLTLETPKPLLELGGQPILELLIRQLVYYGFDEIYVTSHWLSDKIGAYLPTLAQRLPSVNLIHVPQDQLMGTAGGLSSLNGLGRDGAFLVMNGDIISTLNYRALMDYHRREQPALTVGRFIQSQQIQLGVLQLDSRGDITAYQEKPKLPFPVSMGVYCFEPSILGIIPANGWLDVPDLVNQLIAAGQRVATFPFAGQWLDAGTHEDFALADQLLRQNRAEFLPNE
ncbi:MAG: nucleotidyltransferase family protein [Phototrophicaceae bacterium]|jgi:NDP-sugar pyrophosphorylase family protein